MARMDGYDLLIIDTSSGNLADVYEAHLLADVILTPMNESPADMHGLFAPVGSLAAPKVNYREMIETVRFDRRRAGLPIQRWHVIMNRVAVDAVARRRPPSTTVSNSLPPKPASKRSGASATVSRTAASRSTAARCSTNPPTASSP